MKGELVGAKASNDSATIDGNELNFNLSSDSRQVVGIEINPGYSVTKLELGFTVNGQPPEEGFLKVGKDMKPTKGLYEASFAS